MGYIVLVLDWSAYKKRAGTTKNISELFRDERDRTGLMTDIEEESTFGEMVRILDADIDVPWLQEFLSIFSFVSGIRKGEDDSESADIQKRFGYETNPFTPCMEIEPKQVRACLDVWKKIKFKRDLSLIPKRFRKKYRAMAETALEYKQILKRAANEGKGIVVGFTLD